MITRFPIDDLRTLVARALQVGSYSPAESKRIRAVPDTRTIRYYTTLGLIDRPAEMRGRTAFYEPRHVMQLVAIKRLQAANQTLSDVQARLVGITKTQLTKLADLPDGFWESADRYLARKPKTPPESVILSQPYAQDRFAQESDEPREFWSEPAELPNSMPRVNAVQETPARFTTSSANQTSQSLHRCLSWQPVPGVTILVDGAADDSSIDLSRLQDAAVPLLNELLRQGLLKAASLPPEVSP
jgi:DNA-binding transcriptional MerR regulator